MSEFKSTPLISFEKRKMQQTKETRYWRKFDQIYQKKFDDICGFVNINEKRKLFCFGVNNAIMFYNYKENKMFYEYRKENEAVKGFAIRKDGYLAAFSNSSGFVKILNLKHRNLLKSFRLSDSPIYGVDIGFDNSLVISGDDEGNFKAYNFASSMELLSLTSLHSDFFRKIKFFPSQTNKLITGSLDKTSKLIDLNTGKSESTINNIYEIEDLDFIDENTLALVGGKYLKIWDLRNTSEPTIELLIANKTVNTVTATEGRVICGSYDQHLKVFSIEENYKIINQIKYNTPVMGFAADNNLKYYALSLNNKTLEIFRKNKNAQDDEEEDDKYNTVEKNIIKKLFYGVGNRNGNSFKYFNRGKYEGPSDDISVKVAKPNKIKRAVYD